MQPCLFELGKIYFKLGKIPGPCHALALDVSWNARQHFLVHTNIHLNTPALEQKLGNIPCVLNIHPSKIKIMISCQHMWNLSQHLLYCRQWIEGGKKREIFILEVHFLHHQATEALLDKPTEAMLASPLHNSRSVMKTRPSSISGTHRKVWIIAPADSPHDATETEKKASTHLLHYN